MVVDHEGQTSEQIDLVIYDCQYTPLLFRRDGEVFLAAESVYGVFEVKQSLNAGALRYAGTKAASVRQLHRTSAPIHHHEGVSKPQDPKSILAGILTYESEWSPPFGSPFDRALDKLRGKERLDLGCALEHGAFTVTREEGGGSGVTKSEPDTALAFFCLGLLDQLQKLGTVTAIDYGVWKSILG